MVRVRCASPSWSIPGGLHLRRALCAGTCIGGAGNTWATFSDEQKSNACTVVGVGKGAADVPEYGWVVAIAAALVESRVQNLDCGDRDSTGMFQQRTEVGWCDDVADCIDPVKSAFAFYGVASHTSNRGLTDIDGWEGMSVSDAAQAVQVRRTFVLLQPCDILCCSARVLSCPSLKAQPPPTLSVWQDKASTCDA